MPDRSSSPATARIHPGRSAPSYVIRPDGSGLRRLTEGGDDGAPAFSPDGTEVAFVRRQICGPIRSPARGSAVASAASRIGERPALLGDEFPAVASGLQVQLDDPVRAGVPHLAVRSDRSEAVGVGAAGADDELADTRGRIGHTVRVLRRKALVLVVVPVENDFGSAVVQSRSSTAAIAVVTAVHGARGEQRVVEVRERARSRARGQVGAQPLLLCRPRCSRARSSSRPN